VKGNPGNKPNNSFDDLPVKNSQWPIVRLWIFLLLTFIFFIFLPSLIGLDGMDGGFAIGLVSFFMVIVSLVVIVIYRSRAKQVDCILAGEGRIAVWNYQPDEWMRFVERDFAEQKMLNRSIFYLIAGISIVVGILLTIVYQDILMAEIILGLIAFLAVIAFITPYFRLKKLRKSNQLVIISEKGAVIGKMFHLWENSGASLDEVSWNDQNPGTVMIEFTYSVPSRNGRDQQVARVPVPEGKNEEARQVFEHFADKLKKAE
jgi:hypothetical protein